MIMPSLVTWVIGAAVLVVLSVLLRYVANEAHELARPRGRASIAAEPESASTSQEGSLTGHIGSSADYEESPLVGNALEAVQPRSANL
jgi:hypothetical protein